MELGAAGNAGVYGVGLSGAAEVAGLPGAPADAAVWSLILASGLTSDRHSFLSEHAALVRFGDDSEIEIHRDGSAGCAELRLGRPVPVADIAHPYLSPIGILAAHWAGNLPLHAGAFDVDGGAWIIPAGKGSGKTTTLALLATEGHSVLADDLSVISRDKRVHCGPRFVDLREDAAAFLGAGRNVGRLGVRDRWRMPLLPATELPVRGILIPGWGEWGLDPLPFDQRLSAVARNTAVRRKGPWADVLLDVLTTVPVLRWTRPEGLEDARRNVKALVEALESI